jgi:hypothetical protein
LHGIIAESSAYAPGDIITLRFLIAKIFHSKKNRTDQNDGNAYIHIDVVSIGKDAACKQGYG